MFNMLRKPKPQAALASHCLLRIGASMDDLTPADGPGWKTYLDELLRKGPDLIFCHSDNPDDLSMVRKALMYLSEMGGEVGVAPQMDDAEVAAIFGVDVDLYKAAVVDPDGHAGDALPGATLPLSA